MKAVTEFVSINGVENPRGHYCRDCHAERKEEERLSALLAEAEKVPKLKIIFGEWWVHYARPHDFQQTLYSERSKCPYCDAPLPPVYMPKEALGEKRKKRAHIDHMDPLSEGGEDSIRNAVYVCGTCNLLKRGKLFVDWLGMLEPEARERARAIYIQKHSHPPEDFWPSEPSLRSDGVMAELMLSEVELKEMYPEPIVDGPPSREKIVVEFSADDLMQRPGIKELFEQLANVNKKSN